MSESASLKSTSLVKLDYPAVVRMIMEYTVSAAGREQFASWQPFDDLKLILITQERVTALRKLIDEQAPLPLSDFEDLRPALGRCQIPGSFLTTGEVGALRRILKGVSVLHRFLHHRRNLFPMLNHFAEGLQPLSPLYQQINLILDEQEQVRDNASPELKHLRQALQQSRRRLEKIMERLTQQARQAGLLHEDNPTIRDGHFVLPVKVEHKRKLPGIFHGQSATGATVYIEPLEIVEITNEISQLEEEEQTEIQKILRRLTDAIRPSFHSIEQNIALLIELDMLNAVARFSHAHSCHPPHIGNPEKVFTLYNARHPVLAQHKTVVPLNLTTPAGKQLIIISGPNAGGKTVAMKTIGLLTLMALSGWHIPAEPDSQIPFFRQVFVDIGDQQSIENDLSTFSSHIANLQHFLAEADSTSLVLIDELGTGTEPSEGAALSQAILTALAAKGVWTIATTHHHALKEFAEQHPAALNAAMEFDLHTLEPTYRLQLGSPGSSYAFEIAARLGLNPEIIQQARRFLDSSSNDLNTLLNRIAHLKSQLESELKAQSKAKTTLDRLIKEYDQRLANLQAMEKQQSSRLLQELEEFITRSRQQLENTIRNIKEQAASKESILSAHEAFEQVQKELNKVRTHHTSHQKPEVVIPQVGDQVRIASLNEIGMVVAPFNKNRRCAVDVKGKRLWLPVEQLQIVSKPQADTPTVKSVTVNKEIAPILSLDIRGMRVAEAEEALQKFLDRALLAGVSQVEIIHGYGTGALQKLTREVLKNFPGVKRYKFQDFDSGGSGVTLVEF